MYVTRRLSELQKFPDLLSSIPEGPNSGYLVIQDEESVKYSFFGLHKNKTLKELPFPQNKELTLVISDFGIRLFMIPVLNKPLSSNLYYAIDPHGKYKGGAFTCSTKEDIVTRCFSDRIRDVKAKPLDPRNINQQFEILPRDKNKGLFHAKSVTSDSFPPYFFRLKSWCIVTGTPSGYFKLDEACGIDLQLRARLPQINVSPSEKSSQPVTVGKWYCPYLFVKEGTVKDQVKKSMYYEMTLEQRWEQFFSFRTNASENKGNSVLIDALVEKEKVFISGYEAAWNVKNAVDGVIWFTGAQASVGLREEIVQRMKWEEERFGWMDDEQKQMKINKVEKFKEESWQWTELKCYVLVERFNLKRMDGSLVMSYDFKHCDKMQTRWE